jgi:hypothetical protein
VDFTSLFSKKSRPIPLREHEWILQAYSLKKPTNSKVGEILTLITVMVRAVNWDPAISYDANGVRN